VKNSDGSTTLPGGGTLKAGDGVTVTVPENTRIDASGAVAIPSGGRATVEAPDGLKIGLPGGSTVTDGGNTATMGSDGGTISHDGGHTFNIPKGAVVILDADTPLGYVINISNPFADFKAADWYHDALMFAYAHDLMAGTSASPMTFSPSAATTRGMIVTVLYRMAGSPDVSGAANPFSDISSGQYYADAVKWAASKGIVGGYGSGMFGPDDNITREQMAAILLNYELVSGKIPKDVLMDREFADWGDTSDWAKDAVNRLVMQGMLTGKPGNQFDPKGAATRAECAALLMRFVEAVK
jgi:hypothetical protein